MTNNQFREKANEQWVNGRADAYVKVGDKLHKIVSVYVSDKDNIIVEASTKEHVTKLPKDWYDPSEDGLYDEASTDV